MKNDILKLVWLLVISLAPTQQAFATNSPVIPKSAHSKIGRSLTALHMDYSSQLSIARATPGPTPYKPNNRLVPVKGNTVLLDMAATGNSLQLISDLQKLGVKSISSFGRTVSAQVPIELLSQLETISSLKFARASHAQTRAGVVTSQGDRALGADKFRSENGLDGTGIKVGVLSDSYDCLKDTFRGAAVGIANDDLPSLSKIKILKDLPKSSGSPTNSTCADGTDEGRSMMEIVHDIAPGADLSFYTGFLGQADFAQGIIALANDGANVIVDDIGYFEEPFFQDGVIAQAVDTVKAMGVAFFSAAGNDGRSSYESAFRPSGKFRDLGLGDGPQQLHDFDPGPGVATCQKISVPLGADLILSFQWDQPFASVSGAPGSASDMDIVLTDASCRFVLVNEFVERNLGNDPVELLYFQNIPQGAKSKDSFPIKPPGQDPVDASLNSATFGLMIAHSAGPFPGLMKSVMFGDSRVKYKQFNTKSGTTIGHSMAAGGQGVGAVYYKKAPPFKKKKPIAEKFSSSGGTPILFDINGNRLTSPEYRQQPAIMAPDGVDTSFFGDRDNDRTSFPNFYGTSAAAPHAAALAALLLQQHPTWMADDVYNYFISSAIDMDDKSTRGFDTGFDYGTGFGLIQAPQF